MIRFLIGSTFFSIVKLVYVWVCVCTHRLWMGSYAKKTVRHTTLILQSQHCQHQLWKDGREIQLNPGALSFLCLLLLMSRQDFLWTGDPDRGPKLILQRENRWAGDVIHLTEIYAAHHFSVSLRRAALSDCTRCVFSEQQAHYFASQGISLLKNKFVEKPFLFPTAWSYQKQINKPSSEDR